MGETGFVGFQFQRFPRGGYRAIDTCSIRRETEDRCLGGVSALYGGSTGREVPHTHTHTVGDKEERERNQ
jgi:hypothetical protein